MNPALAAILDDAEAQFRAGVARGLWKPIAEPTNEPASVTFERLTNVMMRLNEHAKERVTS